MTEKIEWYREVLKLEPNSKVFFPLARLLAGQDRRDEAIDVMERGLARHGEYLEARLYLIELLHDAGRVADCRRQVDELTKLFAAYAGFWRAWAVCLESSGDRSDAGVALRFLALNFISGPLSLGDILRRGLDACEAAMSSGQAKAAPAERERDAAPGLFGAAVPQGMPATGAGEEHGPVADAAVPEAAEGAAPPAVSAAPDAAAHAGMEAPLGEARAVGGAAATPAMPSPESEAAPDVPAAPGTPPCVEPTPAAVAGGPVEAGAALSAAPEAPGPLPVAEETEVESREAAAAAPSLAPLPGRGPEAAVADTPEAMAAFDPDAAMADDFPLPDAPETLPLLREGGAVPASGAEGEASAPEPVPALAVPGAGDEAFSLRTRSMAEVLAEQGDIKGALDIYHELSAAAVEPEESADLRQRMATLSARLCKTAAAPVLEPEPARGKDRLISLLEALAERVEARALT